MDKVKNQHRTLSSLAIVISWAGIQAVGWIVIYMMIVNLLNQSDDLLMFGFVGLFGGAIMGALQHTLIDRGVGISLKHWFVLTTIGTALGLMGVFWVEELNMWSRSPYLYLLPIFVIPAVFQWWSIRRYTRAGLLWIVGNAIAGIVFVMFVLILDEQGYKLLSAVIPAALQGIASGFVMVWLLRQAPKQALTKEKDKVEYDNKVKVS